eukprot:TRINITY_DN27393_c0_g1_i1.p1 TRINITY_DN27393_c0_g1~~TRINITY_DN27393_c0_g1_i1.p1  ORF type:complete len:994 (+),score=354.18 TRINITY_DN27393_c0_g1_i1:106-2982(+)
MGGGDAFDGIMRVTGFVCAVYFCSVSARMLKMSPIIGELAAGVVLGPEVVKLLKHEQEEFLSLMGQFGVALMIFESGMHVQFDKLKQVFAKSFTVAILGTALPIVGGLLFCLAALGSGEVYPTGLAMGCSMAPTSVGIALKLLTESKMLSSFTGQTIVTGAFVDDIFSIIALVILLNLAKGNLTAVTIMLPLVLSCVFVIGGGFLAYKYWPPLMERIIGQIATDPAASFQRSHMVHLVIMFLTLIGYGAAAHYVGSHLLGAFIGGMSFAAVPRSGAIWGRQMKRIARWLIRLFFSCTVAFSIPISSMMSIDAFWKGLLCGIGPCIGCKLLSGLHTGDQRWLVGFAMAGRGEFAFLVAETAKSEDFKSGDPPYDKLLSKEGYSITVWALLCATIVAPFGFKYFLAKETAKRQSTGIYSFRLKLKGQHYNGIAHDIQSQLRDMALIAEDVTVEQDGHVNMQTMTCVSKVETEWLDDDKFETIRTQLFQTLNDPDGQIAIQPIHKVVDEEAPGSPSDKPVHVGGEHFRPALFRTDAVTPGEIVAQDREKQGRPDRHYVVVKVMSSHSGDFLEKTYDILERSNLVVCKAKMYLVDRYPRNPGDVSVAIKTFYCLDLESSGSGVASGVPSPERIAAIRSILEHQFQVNKVTGKALIKTTRVENAPVIYGFTPIVEEGKHVVDIELVFEQRLKLRLLSQLFSNLCKHRLDVINLAVDIVEGEKSEDHNVQQCTIFAIDTDMQLKAESELAKDIVAVFREYDVPVRVRVHTRASGLLVEGHGQVRDRSPTREMEAVHSGGTGHAELEDSTNPGSPTQLLQGSLRGRPTRTGTMQGHGGASSFRRIGEIGTGIRSGNLSHVSGQNPSFFLRGGGGSGVVAGHGHATGLLRVKKKVKEIEDIIEDELQQLSQEEGGGATAQHGGLSLGGSPQARQGGLRTGSSGAPPKEAAPAPTQGAPPKHVDTAG